MTLQVRYPSFAKMPPGYTASVPYQKITDYNTEFFAAEAEDIQIQNRLAANVR